MKITTIFVFVVSLQLSSAAITSISSSSPTLSSTFTDGGSDYFGIVNSGLILTQNFNSSINPPEGSVAGEDLDGEGGSNTQTVTWTLNLPGDAVPGTGLTTIDFSGLLASGAGFDDADGSHPFVFSVDGSEVGRITFSRVNDGDPFNSALAVDTNLDGFGDGAVATATGTAVTFSDPGGAAVTSVDVVFTISSGSGGEEFWTNGTLSAQYDMVAVPEPSTLLLSVIGAFAVIRRSR